jgi:hypothetical protein
MSRNKELWSVINYYKEETGKEEVDMHEVAEWAMSRQLLRKPNPRTPGDILARELSRAAREEMRHDEAGRAYRANHAVTMYGQNGAQTTFWVDIDKAPRKHIQKSLTQRREQMVGDAVQLSFDALHWNTTHPDEEPIKIELDFTLDVEWRMNGEEAKAG